MTALRPEWVIDLNNSKLKCIVGSCGRGAGGLQSIGVCSRLTTKTTHVREGPLDQTVIARVKLEKSRAKRWEAHTTATITKKPHDKTEGNPHSRE